MLSRKYNGSKKLKVNNQSKVYDLKKRAYLYALEVIKFLEALPQNYIAQTIGKQLLRSATSIGANIVEAQAASSRNDFRNFYSYALKSANESKFWLGLLKDSSKYDNDKISSILDETSELANILASCILTIKDKK